MELDPTFLHNLKEKMVKMKTSPVPKLGLHLPNIRGYSSFKYISELANAAKDAGFSGLFVSDHILYPKEYSDLFVKEGMLEATTALAALASQVKNMIVGTAILLPLRHPIISASLLSTIDQISEGRLVVGLGIGWNRKEFETLGFDRSKRSKLIDDWGKAMRTLWGSADAPVSYDGEFFKFDDVVVRPKTYREKNHPPILIGGAIRHALKRIISYGDGWMPDAPTLEELRDGINLIKNSAPRSNGSFRFMINIWGSIGRTTDDAIEHTKFMLKTQTSPPWALELEQFLQRSVVGDPKEFARRTKSYCEQGAEQIIVGLPPFGREIEMIERIGDEVIPSFYQR